MPLDIDVANDLPEPLNENADDRDLPIGKRETVRVIKVRSETSELSQQSGDSDVD